MIKALILSVLLGFSLSALAQTTHIPSGKAIDNWFRDMNDPNSHLALALFSIALDESKLSAFIRDQFNSLDIKHPSCGAEIKRSCVVIQSSETFTCLLKHWDAASSKCKMYIDLLDKFTTQLSLLRNRQPQKGQQAPPSNR